MIFNHVVYEEKVVVRFLSIFICGQRRRETTVRCRDRIKMAAVRDAERVVMTTTMKKMMTWAV